MAPSHAWWAILALAAGCGDASPAIVAETAAASATAATASAAADTSATAVPSTLPPERAADCVEVHRLLFDLEGKLLGDSLRRMASGEPDPPLDPETFAVWAAHGEAMKKLELRDPEMKKFVADHLLELEKVHAAGEKHRSPATRQEAAREYDEAWSRDKRARSKNARTICNGAHAW